MAIKFLYIDDEKLETSEGIVKNLRNENLEFIIERPQSWNEQKLNLIENQSIDKYDGLLLDLKLEFSDGDSNDVKFSGTDLAQTIRSDVKSGKIKDLPIFLCSTDDNFMSLFDRTSFDLFDRKYRKDKDFENEDVRNEFIAFAKAYHNIIENNDIENLLQKKIIDNDDLVALNAELKDFKTPHEFVYLINRYVIQSNGILLDEEMLAIRLGIDTKSSTDWPELKSNLLNEYKYQGILSDFYERWWQKDILNWWKNIFGKSLIIMSAKDKVSAIIDRFSLKELYPLPLPEHHRFDTFWYKCRLSNYPLEPSDALKTIEMPRYAWQEPSYISVAYIKSDERDRALIVSLLGANEMRIFDNL